MSWWTGICKAVLNYLYIFIVHFCLPAYYITSHIFSMHVCKRRGDKWHLRRCWWELHLQNQTNRWWSMRKMQKWYICKNRKIVLYNKPDNHNICVMKYHNCNDISASVFNRGIRIVWRVPSDSNKMWCRAQNTTVGKNYLDSYR